MRIEITEGTDGLLHARCPMSGLSVAGNSMEGLRESTIAAAEEMAKASFDEAAKRLNARMR